jgi:Adenylyl/Guanylyl and SMODS C-terminal sensor domain
MVVKAIRIAKIMGIASSLFFSTNSEKQTLHRRIIPTDEQKQKQQERWNDLKDYLKISLKVRSNYSIYSWLQGSYKFATQLRPLSVNEEFDIDLGIYFEWQGDPDDGSFSPLQLKKMVQESLAEYAETQDDIEKIASPKPRCNRVHYTENFHIDTPTYHLDNCRDARALATEHDVWEDSDPKRIYLWFKEEFPDEAERFQVRRLIRYMKAWSILNIDRVEGRPSAILLTILISECYKKLDKSSISGEDVTLAEILRLILERLEQDSKVLNPVNISEVLSDRLKPNDFDAFVNLLKQFYELAKQAIAAETELKAADIWSKVFKHFFPLPEPDSEFDLESFSDSRRNLQLVPVFTPNVYVEAKRKKYIYQGTNQWSNVNRIGQIPKNCTITFKLVNANQLPFGAAVEWMVRNEGNEAESVNDLGHPAGTGHVITENSAYKGRHYMDCIIRQYGQVISMRRIPVDVGLE